MSLDTNLDRRNFSCAFVCMDNFWLQTQFTCMIKESGTSCGNLPRIETRILFRLFLHKHISDWNSISNFTPNNPKQLRILAICSMRRINIDFSCLT